MRTISMILMKERTSMEQVFQYVDQMFEQYVKEVATLCSFRSVKGDNAGLQACRNLLKKKLDALRRNGTGVSALDRGRQMWYDNLD